MANKQIGYFNKFLTIDCETTGFCKNSLNPVVNNEQNEQYQAIAWGIVVTDTTTYTPIEKYYFEIKYDGVSTWSNEAQKVHGLSIDYLEQHGITEEEFVVAFSEIVLKHFGPDSCVYLAGNNVSTFDYPFLYHTLSKHDVYIKFGHRQIDVTSVALIVLNTFTSKETFELLALNRDEYKHNALEDALCSLSTLRAINKLSKRYILQ